MRLRSVFSRLLVDCWLVVFAFLDWCVMAVGADLFNSVVHVIIFAHLALDICYLWTWLGNV